MKVTELHGWQVGIPEAREIQRGLAKRVSRSGDVETPRFIAGVDISVGRGVALATGAVVVLSYPELKVVEVRLSRSRLRLPYIPGLLSFREAPLILDACWSLERVPDLILVDGQGISHPRRLGLASHLGLFLDTPTIGCAKSRLIGTFDEPPAEKGTYSSLLDDDEVIGAVVRTRSHVKPLFVSVGHRCRLADAIRLTLACTTTYRLPEPTRLAHQTVNRIKQG